MGLAERISVEVAYALPNRQCILPVEVDAGATLEEAVHRSGILQHFPEIALENCKLGVFGKLRKREDVIGPGERVEIYRPLVADPKESRRRRAAHATKGRVGIRTGS